jgi:TolA-binding protein
VPPPSQRPAPVAASSGNEPLSPTDLPALAPTPSARPSPSRLGSAPAIVLEDAPEPAPNPEVASYRQAHRTHFDGAPPSVALAAWDKYLAAYPAGSFAPDARFNRALCLLRLGRNADARAALAPFAQAPAGGYRQAEAASLLRSLDDAAEKN